MPVSSLLALIDDIASVLDDVALLGRMAVKQTSGVIADDLALNAQQVAGLRAERELPVVWAVAKGSLRNKAILVPAALVLSTFLPGLVEPVLMLGGAYLCYEGFEKIAHGGPPAAADALPEPEPAPEAAEAEQQKIRGAIRTDFVLSAEIIVITLGSVADAAWLTQGLVLAGVALAMTVGVYGLVAAIVKLDDLGLWLSLRPAAAARAAGRLIVTAAPGLMRLLSLAGTTAMFLVGGGILVHGLVPLHDALALALQPLGTTAGGLLQLLAEALAGVAAGAVLVLAAAALRRSRTGA
jgi:predicted DNA repair protein MutK